MVSADPYVACAWRWSPSLDDGAGWRDLNYNLGRGVERKRSHKNQSDQTFQNHIPVSLL
jgi:hypothetical protein